MLTEEGIELDGLIAADEASHLVLQRSAEDLVDHVGVHALHVSGSTRPQVIASVDGAVLVVYGRTYGHQFGMQTVEHVSQKLVGILLVVATKSRHNLLKRILS